MYCSEVLNGLSEEALIEKALKDFKFPEDAQMTVDFFPLRLALYNIYGRKDFYTGEPLALEDMTLDHVIPKSKGGPDNIFNYVPTSSKNNNEKGSLFYQRHYDALKAISISFAPKILERLKANGQIDKYIEREATRIRRLEIAEIYLKLTQRRRAEIEERDLLILEESLALKTQPGVYVEFDGVDVDFLKKTMVIVDTLSGLSEEEVYAGDGEVEIDTDLLNLSQGGEAIELASFRIFTVSELDIHRQEVDQLSGPLIQVIDSLLVTDLEGQKITLRINLGFLDKLFKISRIESEEEQERALLNLFEADKITREEYFRW